MVDAALLTALLSAASSALITTLVREGTLALVRAPAATPAADFAADLGTLGLGTPAAAAGWDLTAETSPVDCACLPASFGYCVEPLAAALVDAGALGASVCYEFRFHLGVVLFGGLCFALGRLTAPAPLRRPDVRRGPAAHHPGRPAD